ncbi:replication-relaxation family protein [Streptomyces sp. H10-C2]|uniref:replication-relaxation family protein n=1 Tax=unclassified Streptomyces TaxID=2593676 RepID=UPI0024B8A338|nr:MULTISPECIES: replication-relaxation family protein [unclassified Streptomyces]MDJ0347617.1 replication-relaxation family protein [Streptomyces sp. PH10-H1]MDJ0375799.1 replication-relaxation family protein [Streptomyces sp. H10-C2]
MASTESKPKPRSTVRDQKDALRVLGVLKVATATQILNLVRPHLTDNKVMRNALLVLEARGEVVSEGNTAGPAGRFGAPDRTGEPSQKLWGLTPAGLDAAGRLLERGPEEMGGRARGAGRGGAPHAMGVNATIVAFSRGGIGDVASWRTEVPHALATSGKQNVRADALLRAKEAGLPLLMVEVDRATEPVERVADKLAAYAACYRRRVNDPGTPSTWTSRRTGESDTVPYWETLYPETGLPGWPPLAFVFTGAGPRALHNRMQELAALTREYWAADECWYAQEDDGYLDFTDKVPLVLTTLDRLQEHGPHGPVWRRVAQERGQEFEPLLTALTDTRTLAAYQQRARKRRAAAEARWQAEQAAREAKQQQQLQQWQAEEDKERAPAVPQCATPHCEQLVDAPVDWYTDITVPPEDGIYCGPCRHDQAYRNRGLRGALRRIRKPSGDA